MFVSCWTAHSSVRRTWIARAPPRKIERGPIEGRLDLLGDRPGRVVTVMPDVHCQTDLVQGISGIGPQQGTAPAALERGVGPALAVKDPRAQAFGRQ